jgi:hypothetical protein
MWCCYVCGGKSQSQRVSRFDIKTHLNCFKIANKHFEFLSRSQFANANIHSSHNLHTTSTTTFTSYSRHIWCIHNILIEISTAKCCNFFLFLSHADFDFFHLRLTHRQSTIRSELNFFLQFFHRLVLAAHLKKTLSIRFIVFICF